MAAGSAEVPLIAIVGETASGKSAMAVELAFAINGEIVCADSRTIYKGMDIGTAKPTHEQMRGVSHHMLDLVNPDQKYSAAEFQYQAKNVIDDICRRGKWPIMVGGSGLYVDSILYDYSFRSATDWSRRKTLESRSLEDLNELARSKRLAVYDSKNKRYLVRLLETGEQPADDRKVLRTNTLVIGVNLPRSAIRKNIEVRVETMFQKGLRREVSELLKIYNWSDPGMDGIGYREFQTHYQDESSVGYVKRKIITNTLQLAKRQRTWFKRNQSIRWISDYSDVSELVKSFIEEVASQDDGKM